MSLLEIRNVQLVYPNGHEALKSISMSAEAGEIIAVVGRSGAASRLCFAALTASRR